VTAPARQSEPSARGRYEGKLELTWTNKHKSLLAHEDGSYEWVPPSDYRVAEVRLLRDAASFGDVGPARARDNLLVRGDALHALTSLGGIPEFAREYAGKVKLVYIDPPFNTQQAFMHYDDALEHSVWLTMMRDRLEQIKVLLALDGSVWVHLDDTEMAYCRAMMDEVFGRESFVATVVWEKADSPRNSARWLSVDHDYIIVYARDPEAWLPYRLPRTEEANAIYSNPDDDPRGAWLPGDPYANKPYSRGQYVIEGPTGRTFQPPPGRFWRVSQEKFEQLDSEGRIWWGPKGSARPSIKRYLSEVAELVPRTLWSRNEVGSNRTSKNEMRRLFPGAESFATPKPERLMERIIRIGSRPGDIVLDCFAGAGTTAAVAHKLRRRWVAIEWERETIETFALPRLQLVVDGKDDGGITAEVDWTGGGGFRVLDVAPSMFAEDEGLVVLAEWATKNQLSEATAAQLGYDYQPDPPFVGRKGRARLAVIDGLVNPDVVKLLVHALPEGERLVLCGTAVDPDTRDALRELRPGSTVRKIPASILAEYQLAQRWRPSSQAAKASSSESAGRARGPAKENAAEPAEATQ
jgi:adenine-specific DNA-methyltransferase